MLLTPPGAAAIAVVRIAGPGVAQFLAKCFSREAPDARCVHGTLSDESGNVLDDPVVVCSHGGTVSDLNLHSSAWVVESVLQLAERHGFTRVEPTSFPEVAHDDEAASQIEREVLAHVPAARTELALRTLLAQPDAWARLGGRASREELDRMLNDQSLVRLLNPPRVAIVGAPNVGKSTLANQLFGEARSITADVPGTTRDWVGATANIDGLAVTLVDTPGVRETGDSTERDAIERSDAEVQRADLVIVVLDATRPLDPEQRPQLNAHPDAIVVANKVDGPAAWDVAGVAAIRTVALSGQGTDVLREAIRDRFGCRDASPNSPRIWTARQRAIVVRAMEDPEAIRDLVPAPCGRRLG